MFEILVEDYFNAAHRLRNYQGKCEELHGHNWKVQVHVAAEKLDKAGMLMDFKDLKEHLKNILQKLDHHYLNEVSPFDKFNPTSENLARFVYQGLKESLAGTQVNLSKVTVWETEKACASYSEMKPK